MTLAFQLAVLLSITQSLLVSIGLIRINKLRSYANAYLAVAIGSISMAGLCVFLGSLSIEAGWYVTLNDIMWEFIFPGAFMLYIAKLLDHPLAAKSYRWLVFAPFAVTLLINLFLDASHELHLYSLPFSVDNSILQAYYGIESLSTVLFALLGIFGSYLILIRRKQHIAFLWAREFWRWSSAVTFLWIVVFSLGSSYPNGAMTFVWIGFIVFISFLIYRGVLQYQLINQRLDVRVAQEAVLHSESQEAVLHSESQEDLISAQPAQPQTCLTYSITKNQHLNALDKLMSDELLFRNPALSRNDAAERVGISGGHLTKLLSKYKAMSFTTYVNQHRVEDVQRMLLNSQFDHLSLLAIGLEAGFNSKSAFYSSFRKVTGVSPSAYRQSAAKTA